MTERRISGKPYIGSTIISSKICRISWISRDEKLQLCSKIGNRKKNSIRLQEVTEQRSSFLQSLRLPDREQFGKYTTDRDKEKDWMVMPRRGADENRAEEMRKLKWLSALNIWGSGESVYHASIRCDVSG